MLNQSRLLSYIKQNLGFAFMTLELTDDQILEYCTTYTLREFSSYFPYVKRVNLDIQDSSCYVPNRTNEFYIDDGEGLEILNIVDIYVPSTNLLMFGHPPMGPLSLNDLKNFALNVEIAGMIKQFSNWNYTFEFSSPNVLRISPTPKDSLQDIAVEIECMQKSDLSKIPNEMQQIFMDLCLAETMVRIGRIRQRFSSGGTGLTTPFGNIPIGSEIFEEGQTMRREIIEKLQASAIPNVSICIA